MLVTGTDLNLWANRRDAQGVLPQLVRRLIHATIRRVLRIGFPAGEAVQMGGWDGILVVEEGNAFVPDGQSVWEFGTNRDVKTKADNDYEKRVANPLGITPAETAFFFVTPRRWGNKDDWAAERQAEGVWREVRAYDADDLEAWLEQAPAVHVWLSILLGKHPEGATDLSTFWRDWSEATDPPLTPSLVIADRREVAAKVLEWTREEPSVLALRADSREEALSFFLAAVHELPVEERVALLARGAVVHEAAAWRRLSASVDALLLGVMFDDRSMVGGAVRQAHHVLVPLGRGDSAASGTLGLPRLSRDAAEAALAEMGIPRERASVLATLARRSMMSLRRRLAINVALQEPAWARPDKAGELLAAMLTGTWNDAKEGDQEVLGMLSRQPYPDLGRVLARWANESDPPLRRVADTWMIVSKEDAWALLARFLAREDLDALEAVVETVLGTTDPAFDLVPEQRWMAGVLGEPARHSGLLREGLADTLALMAARSETTALLDGSSGQERANRTVRRLLERANGDWRVWASLAHVLPLLAEAAPEVFLEAVDAGASGEAPVLVNLFADQEQAMFSSSPHTGLLWALEVLAWSPEYLGHASLLLARLARLDPGGRTLNRPDRSLAEIFLCWRPQTAATLDQRLRVLDALRGREAAVAWRLLVALLPEDYATAFRTATPRWRDWAEEEPQVAPAETSKATNQIVSRLLEDVGTNGGRWRALIARLEALPPEPHKAVVDRLLSVDVGSFGAADRAVIWGALHEAISRHREFAGEEWVLPAEYVDRLQVAHERFAPDDPVVQHAWLFSHHPPLLSFSGEDFEERDRQVAEQRSSAMSAVHERGGLPSLLELAERVEDPWAVGSTLGWGELVRDEEDELLRRCLAGENAALANMAHGFVGGRFRSRGWTWVEEKLAAGADALSAEQRAAVLVALPFETETWDRLEAIDAETQRLYWLRINPYAVKSPQEAERAGRKLMENGRPFAAVTLLSKYALADPSEIPPPLVVEALEQAVRTTPGTDGPKGSFTYQVGKLLRRLEGTGAVEETRLAALEWAFLPLLSRREHGPKVLHRELARNPEFFAEIVSLVYVAEGEEGIVLPEGDLSRARLGQELLDSWTVIPGLREDGSVDADQLGRWVATARELLAARGRGAIGDILIGQQLRYSPSDPDGAWPATPVRELIETFASKELERGIVTEVLNSRGITWRGVTAGGAQERALEEQYRGYAGAVGDRWPRTAAMLRRIAETYGREARREDASAELREDLWR
jgi:hypothetical protein